MDTCNAFFEKVAENIERWVFFIPENVNQIYSKLAVNYWKAQNTYYASMEPCV